jgi:nucleoside-diphosphate-sugar epimerase
MKILVTGGSGYLGSHVRRYFSADDFSRRSNLDILNLGDTEQIQDYDAVIHLAAYMDKSPSGADLSFRTNVEGTRNVLQHVRPNAVFIYASTKDVYGKNANAYPTAVPETCETTYANHSAFEWSKLIGERYVEYYAAQGKFRACIFRLSAVYARPTSGNENGFVTHYVESIKHGRPIRLPASADPRRDILYVDDFSRACQAFIDSARLFGLYNLGGGSANAAYLREIIQTVGNLIQLEPVIENDERLALPEPLHYVSDLTRIREELGWEPRISIEEGLRNLL